MAGSGWDLWRRRRRKRELTGGAHMAVTREKASRAECRNQRRKRNLTSASRVLKPNGLCEGAASGNGRVGRHGQTGPAGTNPKERFLMDIDF
jgi:hypothetical protein